MKKNLVFIAYFLYFSSLCFLEEIDKNLNIESENNAVNMQESVFTVPRLNGDNSDLQIFNCSSTENIRSNITGKKSIDSTQDIPLANANLTQKLIINSQKKLKDIRQFSLAFVGESEYQICTKSYKEHTCVYVFDKDHELLGTTKDLEQVSSNFVYMDVNISSIKDKLKNRLQIFNDSPEIQDCNFVAFAKIGTWQFVGFFPQDVDCFLTQDIIDATHIIIEPENKKATYSFLVDASRGDLNIYIKDPTKVTKKSKLSLSLGKKNNDKNIANAKYEITINSTYNKDDIVVDFNTTPFEKKRKQVGGIASVLVKIQNKSQGLIKTNFAYSSITHEGKTYIPFLDGMQYKDASRSIPPDKVIPPGLDMQFDFYSSAQVKGATLGALEASDIVLVLCLNINSSDYFYTVRIKRLP